jgi:Domain of unknown function (DUF4260)/Protein of unknown function (DUF2637)
VSAADRVIRWSTAVAVLSVAAVAAVAPYEHAYDLVRAHGEAGWTARLVPLMVDGLIYACAFAGPLWAFHIAGDRVGGYGLKFTTGFQDTHLGRIGKRRLPGWRASRPSRKRTAKLDRLRPELVTPQTTATVRDQTSARDPPFCVVGWSAAVGIGAVLNDCYELRFGREGTRAAALTVVWAFSWFAR